MRPMLCNTQAVQNILAGRQTQDRRPTKPQPILMPNATTWTLGWDYPSDKMFLSDEHGNMTSLPNPKYQTGDILYVRENIRAICYGMGDKFEYGTYCIEYLADDQIIECPAEYEEWWWHNWHARPATTIPSIHMPKWAARIFLKVTKVRCERVQDISENDAIREGTPREKQPCGSYPCTAKQGFEILWNSIYPGSWERNDWCFVYDFELADNPELLTP